MKTFTLTIADVYKNKKQQEGFRKYLKEKTNVQSNIKKQVQREKNRSEYSK